MEGLAILSPTRFRRLQAQVIRQGQRNEQTEISVECLTSARAVELFELTPEGGSSNTGDRELQLTYQLVDPDAGIDREYPLELSFIARGPYRAVAIVPDGPRVTTTKDV